MWAVYVAVAVFLIPDMTEGHCETQCKNSHLTFFFCSFLHFSHSMDIRVEATKQCFSQGLAQT